MNGNTGLLYAQCAKLKQLGCGVERKLELRENWAYNPCSNGQYQWVPQSKERLSMVYPAGPGSADPAIDPVWWWHWAARAVVTNHACRVFWLPR